MYQQNDVLHVCGVTFDITQALYGTNNNRTLFRTHFSDAQNKSVYYTYFVIATLLAVSLQVLGMDVVCYELKKGLDVINQHFRAVFPGVRKIVN